MNDTPTQLTRIGEWRETEYFIPLTEEEKCWTPDEFEDILVWVRMAFPADSGRWCLVVDEPRWQLMRDDIPDLWTWLRHNCLHPYYLGIRSVGTLIEIEPQDMVLFKMKFGGVDYNQPDWLSKSYQHKNRRYPDGSSGSA
jgi:hypothetical protein